MGNLRVVEEKQNIHRNKFSQGNSETLEHSGYLANRCLPEFTILNSNEARVNILRSLSWSMFFYMNLLGRKGSWSNVLSESCFLINLKSISPIVSFRVVKLLFSSVQWAQGAVGLADCSGNQKVKLWFASSFRAQAAKPQIWGLISPHFIIFIRPCRKQQSCISPALPSWVPVSLPE